MNLNEGVYADGIKIQEVRSIDDAFKTYEKEISSDYFEFIAHGPWLIYQIMMIHEFHYLYKIKSLGRGLRQRRVAETSLNLTSSRSHSILTVHVVRVPYDEDNGEVYYDENDLDLTKYASSLHFVDLAGSERQNRTKAAGDRLKEAGNINNSLMTLRRCIEALRKNQKSSTGHSEPVPYRSSKITHIFRNFFEVLGGVKLVICINPAAAEFEENLNVLKFAEDAQSIQCKREVKGK